MKTCYIAGPMTGYPEFNFPAFFAAEKKLQAEGWAVWNPAAKDMEAGISERDAAEGNATAAIANGFDFREAFDWDTTKVIQSDAIFMLKGWEHSPGARGEHSCAVAMQTRYPAYQIMYEG